MISIILLFFCNPVSIDSHLVGIAPNEPTVIKEGFIKAMNESDVNALYDLCNESMRQRTSSSTIRKNLAQILSQIGPVRSLELIESTSTSYVYRSVHRLASLKVVFDIDASCLLSAMSIETHTYDHISALPRSKSALALPFHGEWYVFWGGSTLQDNYHNAYPSMRGAFDFWIMGKNGRSSVKSPKRNEDFYAFGKEILAPTDGQVILINDGIKDNDWPEMNKKASFGNFVMIETAHKEYFLFAHLKHHSISVQEGQVVSKGSVLGLCGNSGNSTEPHLHLQMQNVADLMSAKSSYIYFNNIKVDGVIKNDHSPRRGEKVKNLY